MREKFDKILNEHGIYGEDVEKFYMLCRIYWSLQQKKQGKKNLMQQILLIVWKRQHMKCMSYQLIYNYIYGGNYFDG